jgi:hypothetical protein
MNATEKIMATYFALLIMSYICIRIFDTDSEILKAILSLIAIVSFFGFFILLLVWIWI